MFGEWMGNDRIDLELNKTSKSYVEGYFEGKEFKNNEWRRKIKKKKLELKAINFDTADDRDYIIRILDELIGEEK